MAIETVNIIITASAYTLIGDGVTNLSSEALGGESVDYVVVEDGGTAPVVGGAKKTTNKPFYYNDDAADIYAKGTSSSFTLEIFRK